MSQNIQDNQIDLDLQKGVVEQKNPQLNNQEDLQKREAQESSAQGTPQLKSQPASNQNTPSAPGTLIGKTSATQNEPTSIDEFPFWIEDNKQIEAMDYVSVKRLETKPQSTTVGIVTRIKHTTDAKDHLDNWAANNFGQAITSLSTPRLSATVGYAKVMHNTENCYMPVREDLNTHLAQPSEIQAALGINNVPQNEQISFGLIKQSNGSNTIALGDIRYVLGGEGAHVSISGISGLATKSSYAMFLVEQIHNHTFYGPKTSIIIVNVKKDDLLHIHEQRPTPKNSQGQQLLNESNQLRNLLNLSTQPYEAQKVHYLLPLGLGGNYNTYTTPTLIPKLNPLTMYAYDVSDLPRILPFLFSRIISEGDWESGEALLYDLGEEIQQLINKNTVMNLTGNPQNAGNIYNLVDTIAGKGKAHDDRTGRKFKKHWKRLVGTGNQGVNTGILVDKKVAAVSLQTEITNMIPGHIYVVDIARLNGEEQQMVFGDLMSAADECISGILPGPNKPDKIVVVFDELNKYAPSGSRSTSSLTNRILDVAERGRSFGLSLIGAAQFNSAVHPRIVGNTSTQVMGRSEGGELNNSMYRHLEPDVKSLITRLEKGEMFIKHPIYRQPIRVQFPIPAFYQPGS